MTPEQIKIIKPTFAQAKSNKEAVVRMFYDRLFAIAPETRAMFSGDMEVQGRKLMDTLALAVGMLRDTPALVTTLQALVRATSRMAWRRALQAGRRGADLDAGTWPGCRVYQ